MSIISATSRALDRQLGTQSVAAVRQRARLRAASRQAGASDGESSERLTTRFTSPYGFTEKITLNSLLVKKSTEKLRTKARWGTNLNRLAIHDILRTSHKFHFLFPLQKRYQLRLFSELWELPEHLLKMWGMLHETRGVVRFVQVALSISDQETHPHSARLKELTNPKQGRAGNSPLNKIGLRIFGRNPVTLRPFDFWAPAPDRVLQRITDVILQYVDPQEYDNIRDSGYKHNMLSTWWGNNDITVDWQFSRQPLAESLKQLEDTIGCVKLPLHKISDSTGYYIDILGASAVIPNAQAQEYGIVSEDGDAPPSVLCSVSIVKDGKHPFSARSLHPHPPEDRSPSSADRPLDSIGIRIFGQRPRTGERFDSWVFANDSVLKQILQSIRLSVDDQDRFDEKCKAGLEFNLQRKWVEGLSILPKNPERMYSDALSDNLRGCTKVVLNIPLRHGVILRIMRYPVVVPHRILMSHGIASAAETFPRHAFMSISVSPDGPHPHAARLVDQKRYSAKDPNPQWERIGVRIFGTHPDTGAHFDTWIHVADTCLALIQEELDAVQDRESLEHVCRIGFDANMKGECWGKEEEDCGPIMNQERVLPVKKNRRRRASGDLAGEGDK